MVPDILSNHDPRDIDGSHSVEVLVVRLLAVKSIYEHFQMRRGRTN